MIILEYYDIFAKYCLVEEVHEEITQPSKINTEYRLTVIEGSISR